MRLWFAALETMPEVQQIDLIRHVMRHETWRQLTLDPHYNQWIGRHYRAVNALSDAAYSRE
jgi:hypothetical protein